MRDEIEPRQHERVRHIMVLLEIVRDTPREDWPLLQSDRATRPAVVAGVDPAVPEGQGDVQPSELGRGPGRKLVLDAVEATADGVVLLRVVIGGVGAQLLDEDVARCLIR